MVAKIELEYMIGKLEDPDTPTYLIDAIDDEFTYIFNASRRHAVGRGKTYQSPQKF